MKIICIGRNYAAHANELHNPVPVEPVFFMKPDTALLPNNHPFFLPDFSADMQYETELVVRICKAGRSIQQNFAYKYYDQIGIGIDFTARDLQAVCKQKGLPWEIAKAFDFSAPVGRFLPKERFDRPYQIGFGLKINGEWRQRGNSSDMIFDFDHIIAYVSRFVTLRQGDLIFTGTPAGVGQAQKHDHFELFIENECLLAFNVK